MKQLALAALVLALLSGVARPQLSGLIKKNVEDAMKFDQQRDLSVRSARIWIHIRSDGQKAIAEEILEKLEKAAFEKIKIEKKPVQTVTFGPTQSQLRYFKKEDETQAKKLYAVLKKLIPGLELRDFSAEFAQVRWLKPGHYELWLSPGLAGLAS